MDLVGELLQRSAHPHAPKSPRELRCVRWVLCAADQLLQLCPDWYKGFTNRKLPTLLDQARTLIRREGVDPRKQILKEHWRIAGREQDLESLAFRRADENGIEREPHLVN